MFCVRSASDVLVFASALVRSARQSASDSEKDGRRKNAVSTSFAASVRLGFARIVCRGTWKNLGGTCAQGPNGPIHRTVTRGRGIQA